jgi:serine/threonine-protein kinase
MPLATGARLGPYEVLSPLGAGGMGEVYKARDTRLDRDVAVKVMGASMAANPAMRQQLLHEARAASALNHPHICTVHDVGDQDGCPFIAMEWIDGESLASRLNRTDAPLPIDEVLRLGAQVADALDAAHTAGIVHRDLKPANLFITRRGDAKILDFGLAKSIVPADDLTVSLDTVAFSERGKAVGTVAYMAPEQARGERVDARSDLFSFGVVLYEMATGKPAFDGATTAVIFDAVLNRQPPKPQDINRDVPGPLEDVITRLLAKDPASRPASARALRDELEAIRQGRATDRPSGSTSVMPSLAVLPFANLSPEPENEYIADGITEEILNALTQLPGLQVAARTSSFAFKGRTPDLAEIAAKLHVAHVLTGSVRKSGPRLRITVQLVTARDGFPVWSERYDRQTDDIFRIQDEIATAIAHKLRVTLTGTSDEPLVKRGTNNIEAYELYLKGRFLVNQRGASIRQGLDCFERSLALDPGHAPAHAALANSLGLLAFYGYAPPYEAMPKARAAALTAIAIDPTLAEPHAALLFVSWAYDWDWKHAERLFTRAIDLDPRNVSAYQWRSLQLSFTEGRQDDAIAVVKRAVQIDPLSAPAYTTLSTAYVCAKRYDEAAEIALRGMDLDPQLWIIQRVRVVCLRELGQLDAALALGEQALVISNRHHWMLQEQMETLYVAGRTDAAKTLAEEQVERGRSATRYIPPMNVAGGYAMLGKKQESMEWLERAYREHDMLPIWNSWPLRTPTIRDAAGAAILRRTGLQPGPDFRTND